MPSVSPTQVPSLVTNTGVQTVASVWPTLPQLWRQWAEVIPIAQASHAPWGDKSTSFSTDAYPLPRKDGAEIQATTEGEDYTPQGNIRLAARKIGITQRQMEAENAQTAITTSVRAFMADFMRYASLIQDTHHTDIFKYGAYTAGHLATFDGSFVGNVDPYPTLIYDGDPFFSDSHPVKHATTTFDNYLAGTALDAAGITAARLKINKTNAVDEIGRQTMQLANAIMVPSDLEYTLDVLLDSTQKASTSLNDKNVYQGKFTKIVNPLLTDTDGWFMGVSGQGVRGFDGGEPTFETVWDPQTKTWWVIGEFRYGGYVRNWRPWLAANTSTS